MRKLILILFILLSCASLANSGGVISFPGGGVPSAPCDASWSELTSPEWTYDADHTTDDLYACLDGGTSTESGDVDTALCTPGTTSDAQSSGHSGGQAICAASGTIQFDNSNGAVDFRQGEVSGTIWITNTHAGLSYPIRLSDPTNFLDIVLLDDEAGLIIVIYDDDPDAAYVSSTSTGDLTAYVNTYWIDFICQWDQSRDTGDEVTCKTRVQDGTPSWTAWSNSTDADTFSFDGSGSPGAPGDEMDFGANATNSHNIEIDDLEFRSTISTWEF